MANMTVKVTWIPGILRPQTGLNPSCFEGIWRSLLFVSRHKVPGPDSQGPEIELAMN